MQPTARLALGTNPPMYKCKSPTLSRRAMARVGSGMRLPHQHQQWRRVLVVLVHEKHPQISGQKSTHPEDKLSQGSVAPRGGAATSSLRDSRIQSLCAAAIFQYGQEGRWCIQVASRARVCVRAGWISELQQRPWVLQLCVRPVQIAPARPPSRCGLRRASRKLPRQTPTTHGRFA